MQYKDLQSSLIKELEHINYPAPSWPGTSSNSYDVVIIGAGMAGLTAAFALKRLGISNIQVFDRADRGLEGPWATYARMPTLRSTKELVGPALDISSLTFRAWYEWQFGEEKWEKLKKIPTLQWMDYLNWFRKVLQIPVQDNQVLTAIVPKEYGLKLTINGEDVNTSKVVLATGRGGYGGSFIPEFVNNLPPQYYAHTNDRIDFEALQGKRVAIIGAGASGFDAAAATLEKGATLVDILLRRLHLPNVNKFASITYAGFSEGYHNLSDEKRWILMTECFQEGIPPPVEALERVKHHSHFSVNPGIHVHTARIKDNQVQLETNKGLLAYDFLILATGFAIEGRKQPELAPFVDQIQLWKDRNTQSLQGPSWFDQSPYLGAHFQFLERIPGSAPFLKNIYCFNYAATLSHALLSSDIPCLGVGASRLAQGIASDLFTENWKEYHRYLQEYQTPELSEENYNFFNR
jgi:FAD-dependent urate hydroxylase